MAWETPILAIIVGYCSHYKPPEHPIIHHYPLNVNKNQQDLVPPIIPQMFIITPTRLFIFPLHVCFNSGTASRCLMQHGLFGPRGQALQGRVGLYGLPGPNVGWSLQHLWWDEAMVSLELVQPPL